jgi:adenylate cyclase
MDNEPTDKTDANADRRLAAILAADVVGYSRLMHGDDRATLRLLNDSRELFGREAGQRGGRIVNAPGDSVLVEFASVVQAVQCALEVQRRFAERNADLPEDRRMRFRIGVNLGDVLVDTSGVYGDGVNVAARLESLCEPGAIAISASAYEQVRDRLDVEFIDDGEHEVKNIARPVHVYRINVEPGAALGRVATTWKFWRSLVRKPGVWKTTGILAAGVAAMAALLLAVAPEFAGKAGRIVLAQLGRLTQTTESRASIAVLPFSNQSGDAQRDYFSDGVTEDIINALGRFSGVMVISHNAVQAYKGRKLTPAQISRELGVRYIAQGSVRQADGKLRVSVELSDAEKGVQLWSERFDGTGQQVFDIQDQVVRNIVGVLAVKLTSLEQQRAASKPTDNLEAYDLLLRARALLPRSERSANREARTLLAQAIKLAPDYAAALVALSDAEQQRVTFGWIEDVEEGIGRFEALSRKALALPDPGAHVRAHALLSYIHILRGEFSQALAEADQALALNGSDADAYASRGSVALYQGQPAQAIADIEMALRFNPNIRAGVFYEYVFSYFMAGRHKDAVSAADRGLAKYPNFPAIQVVRAMALAELEDITGAHAAAAQVRRVDPLFDASAFGTRFADGADQRKVQLALGKAGF